MNRMRITITTLVFCLLTVLSGASLLEAAEPQDDEKITAPRPLPAPPVPGTPSPPGGARSGSDPPVSVPVIPDKPGTTIIVPSLPGSDETLAPTQTTPTPDKTVIVPHPPETSPPDQAFPVEIPVIPVLPDTTSPAEIPAIPVLPQSPDRIVLTPPLQQETTPQKETLVPQSVLPKPESPAVLEQDKRASPLDFLPMPTSLTPETQPEPMPEKAEQPSKVRPEEPKAQTPPKEAPKAQTPPQTAQTKPKSGEPLRIPPEAVKTGDLSFLEGCWRGTRPEYHSKRIITERFCFDKNGIGRRTIEDPGVAGTCTGASKGSFDAQGRLIVTSEQGYCTGGANWGPAHMVCEGEGNATPCFWRFPGAGGATQSYKIPLVRE